MSPVSDISCGMWIHHTLFGQKLLICETDFELCPGYNLNLNLSLNLMPLDCSLGLASWIQWHESEIQFEESWNRHISADKSTIYDKNLIVSFRFDKNTNLANFLWNAHPHHLAQLWDIEITQYPIITVTHPFGVGHVLKNQSVFRLFWSNVASTHAGPCAPDICPNC